MYTAARNFDFGMDGKTHVFKVGDEVPEAIAEDEELPRHLILEFVADEDPESLSREQLMAIAGVGPYAEGAVGDGESSDEDEFDKEAFQTALDDFPNKDALIEWAEEIYPELALEAKGKRGEIEAQIVAYASGENEGE